MRPAPNTLPRAGERAKNTVPPAHAGHWYQAMLYLAPVIVVVVVLWIQERRERGRDDSGEDDAAVDGPDP
jgi:hypothetical protein